MKKKENIIISKIKKLSQELNKTPTRKEYIEKYGNPSFRNYGGYNNMLKKAGFIPNRDLNFTKKDIKNKYKEYIKKTGKIPVITGIPKELPKYDLIKKFFKSYSDFIIELGYEPNIKKWSTFNRNEMILFLQEKIDSGILRKSNDLKINKHLPYIDSICKILDCKNWKEVLKIINRDLPYAKSTNRIEVKETNQELLEKFIKLSKKLNKLKYGATAEDIKLHLGYSSAVYTVRFGSMTELKKIAGFTSRKTNPAYNVEEVSKILKNKIKSAGRELKIREIDADEELPSSQTLLRLFKTTSIKNIYKNLI